MKQWILLAWLLLPALAAPAATPAPQSEKVLTMRVDGVLTVAPDGTVRDYRIATPMPTGLQEVLDKAVRGWTFHPVRLNGEPVAARNNMRVTLAARESGDGYAVAVDNVTFRPLAPPAPGETTGPADGDGTVTVTARNLRPGSYPRGLMRAGVEGAVLLYLKLEPDGRVEDVVAVQSSLYDVRGRERTLDQARKQFERNAIDAARRWSFHVETTGDATPTASDLTVTVPVWYSMATRGDDAGKWRIELRGPRQPVPWLDGVDVAQRFGVSDLGENEMATLASAFRVPEGVIGRSL
jgi:TonB family protein